MDLCVVGVDFVLILVFDFGMVLEIDFFCVNENIQSKSKSSNESILLLREQIFYLSGKISTLFQFDLQPFISGLISFAFFLSFFLFLIDSFAPIDRCVCVCAFGLTFSSVSLCVYVCASGHWAAATINALTLTSRQHTERQPEPDECGEPRETKKKCIDVRTR